MSKIDGVSCACPRDVSTYSFCGGLCNALGITSHGLALYLLEGADDARAWASGGESSATRGAAFSVSAARSRTRHSEAFASWPRPSEERPRGGVPAGTPGIQADWPL